jgi:hypothetical protein
MMVTSIAPAGAQLLCLLKPNQILGKQKERWANKEAESLGVREFGQSRTVQVVKIGVRSSCYSMRCSRSMVHI